MTYNSTVLKYADVITTGCVVQSTQDGILKVMTDSPDVKTFTFAFMVKNGDYIFKSSSSTIAAFTIDDVQYYYANYDPVPNVKTEDGFIEFIGDNVQPNIEEETDGE